MKIMHKHEVNNELNQTHILNTLLDKTHAQSQKVKEEKYEPSPAFIDDVDYFGVNLRNRHDKEIEFQNQVVAIQSERASLNKFSDVVHAVKDHIGRNDGSGKDLEDLLKNLQEGLSDVLKNTKDKDLGSFLSEKVNELNVLFEGMKDSWNDRNSNSGNGNNGNGNGNVNGNGNNGNGNVNGNNGNGKGNNGNGNGNIDPSNNGGNGGSHGVGNENNENSNTEIPSNNSNDNSSSENENSNDVGNNNEESENAGIGEGVPENPPNNSEGGNALGDILETIEDEVFIPIEDVIKDTLDPVEDVLEDVVEDVIEPIEDEVLIPIEDVIGDTLEPIEDSLEDVVKDVIEPLENVLDEILNPVEKNKETLKERQNELISSYKQKEDKTEIASLERVRSRIEAADLMKTTKKELLTKANSVLVHQIQMLNRQTLVNQLLI